MPDPDSALHLPQLSAFCGFLIASESGDRLSLTPLWHLSGRHFEDGASHLGFEDAVVRNSEQSSLVCGCVHGERLLAR